jgi:hypothetical protein
MAVAVAALCWAAFHTVSQAAGMIVGSLVFVCARAVLVRRRLDAFRTTHPSMIDAVRRAVHAAHGQHQPSLARKWLWHWCIRVVLRLLWLCHMLLAVLVGQLAYLWQNCPNQSAALYCAAIESAWVLASVSGLAVYCGYEWAAHVPPLSFATALVALLATSFKCRYYIHKDYKITMFSAACVNGSCLFVQRYSLPVVETLLMCLLDATLGSWVVCFCQLGKHPMQIQVAQDMQPDRL